MPPLTEVQRYQIEHEIRLGLDSGAIAIGVGFCRRTIEREWVCLYACGPGKPCQKGAVEPMNKLIRPYIPKGTSLRNMRQAKLDRIANELNQRLRQRLRWNSPVTLLSLLTPPHRQVERSTAKVAEKARRMAFYVLCVKPLFIKRPAGSWSSKTECGRSYGGTLPQPLD